MPNNRNLIDASLTQTLALPASTSAVASTAIDTGAVAHTDFVAECEFLVTIPALTTSELPDTKTMTYTLEVAQDGDAVFGSPSTYATLGVQTGAGGAGSAAIGPYRQRLTQGFGRYVRLKATPSASGAGNASAASATLTAAF